MKSRYLGRVRHDLPLAASWKPARRSRHPERAFRSLPKNPSAPLRTTHSFNRTYARAASVRALRSHARSFGIEHRSEKTPGTATTMTL
jgi:hypothetical protein